MGLTRAKLGVAAVVLRDNSKAVKVVEALRGLGIEATWITEADSIPLSARVVVVSRSEEIEPPRFFKVLYIEDYPSLDCLALQVAASLSPAPRPVSLSVAIDPAQRVGVAYVVDGILTLTRSYPFLSLFEEDCGRVVECLGKGRRLEFFIGFRPGNLTHELTYRLKRLYPHARILVLPDEGEDTMLAGLSSDEEAALKIYFKASTINH